ncbi:glycosyltransferase [Nostoc sp. CENA543]|uniref:WecB/TagA/CpsF family glycosyltransferase n=1 Tax=Nostoc sp. CENA543 TaxID=1869241 RepID=UPI000CA10C73|nr:WecB/TagA/CpsF family glycosyltransferase [Nostoc sp. CENA543]AUT02009.1 glycosyltransferase [Nostoc sp. CENA543]
MQQTKVLNVTIDNLTMVELLQKLKHGGVVFTPNVNHITRLQKQPDFYSVYQEADYIVCDSKILMYASQFLNTPIKEKISGSDLLPAFYNYYKNDETIKIFLLGSETEIVKKAQRRINAKVGREIVVGAYSPSFGFEKNEEECQEIVKMINSSTATVLAVGVGAPKQEMWISKYKEQLKNITVFLAIGATINFEAGTVKRSPKWMSEVGLEWLYRLASEPKRLWKRYFFDVIPFFLLILKQKLHIYQNPWVSEQQMHITNWDDLKFSQAFGMREASLAMTSETESAVQEQTQVRS